MSSSLFLKIIKQTTRYSFVILISVVVANFHRYELFDGSWPLVVHGWHRCKTILLKVCLEVTNMSKVWGFVTSNISIWTTCEKDFREIMIWAFMTSDDSYWTLWREISLNHTYTNYSINLGLRIFIYKLYLTKIEH